MTTLRPSSKVTLSGLLALVTMAGTSIGSYYALMDAMETKAQRAVEPLVRALELEIAQRGAADAETRRDLGTHRDHAADTYARREELDGVREDVREMNRRAGWLIRRREQQEQ